MSLKEEFKQLVQEANQKIQEENARKSEEETRSLLELQKRQQALINLLVKNDHSPNLNEKHSSH